MKFKCRFCNNSISDPFLDLGFSPPSNNYLNRNQLYCEEVHYPLKVYFCKKCYLVQNHTFVPKYELFNQNYHYLSSFSTSWLEHCKNYTILIERKLNLKKDSKIIEIASNDGSLIQFFDKKYNVLGIEPTKNTAKIAKSKGLKIYENFLTNKNAKEIINKYGKADLVIGNNVLAHVPDIDDFIKGAKNILKINGTINFEFPHLYNLIKFNQFDTIYHEHYSYISILFLQKLLKKNNLKLYNIEKINTHGGSLRVYISHKKNSKININHKNINTIIKKEKKIKLNSQIGYNSFAKKIYLLKNKINEFLLSQIKNNKTIYGYSAPAKATTMINYLGIDDKILNGIFDKSHLKINKYTPGKHILILNPNRIKKIKPKILIIFAWNIKDEIKKQLSFTKKWNCKLVCLVPNLKIIK